MPGAYHRLQANLFVGCVGGGVDCPANLSLISSQQICNRSVTSQVLKLLTQTAADGAGNAAADALTESVPSPVYAMCAHVVVHRCKCSHMIIFLCGHAACPFG